MISKAEVKFFLVGRVILVHGVGRVRVAGLKSVLFALVFTGDSKSDLKIVFRVDPYQLQ